MNIKGGKENQEQEFKKLFDLYYPALCHFAQKLTGNILDAEDIVQDVFVMLWEKTENFNNELAVKSYLYTSVKNKCLNQLEHGKVVQKHREYAQRFLINELSINQLIVEEETHRLIYRAINELPPECKKILQLSLNGLKNNEIARELNISINTVKTQKKIAYRHLKIKLNNIYLLAALLYWSIQ